MVRAVVLVSGGLDSATVLALARAAGRECHALSFDYGQRHRVELSAAQQVAARLGAAQHKVMALDIGWMGGSALTDTRIAVPTTPTPGIPITYVPARNTIFLAVALGWAEVLEAEEIHIGANALDYSGYPDCRPAYLEAFQAMARLATRAGLEGRGIRLAAPLVNLRKAEIIATGLKLGVDYSLTISCYDPDHDGRACGRCDSCRLRAEGFAAAGAADPTRYRPGVVMAGVEQKQ
jgi:7-cyano-7-deazaguanine synthase